MLRKGWILEDTCQELNKKGYLKENIVLTRKAETSNMFHNLPMIKMRNVME